MKKYITWIVLLIGIICLTLPANAQAGDPTEELLLNPKIDIELLLPSLDSLFEIAKSINPTLKQEAAAMRANQWNERYTRWIWAQNVSVFYNYSFGSLPFFAYTNSLAPQIGLVEVQSGYRAGVNIQLSVYDVLGNKGRVNESKEKVIVQKYKRDAEAMELRLKLNSFYADMVGYNRLYKGRNEDYTMQMVACQVAEKEYKEGSIHFSEYARQKNVLANAEAAYHESFRFYYGALKQFEAILGLPLHKVILKQTKK